MIVPDYVRYLTLSFIIGWSSARVEYNALAGQMARLPCNSSIFVNDTTQRTATLIRWFHPRFHRPIYTLDLRFGQRNTYTMAEVNSAVPWGRHFPSPDVEGRVYLDVTSLPVVLHLDPVVLKDAGRYMCRTDFKNLRSITDIMYLEVIEPVKKLIITDGSGRNLEGVIGPYELGSQINITCRSIGGNPAPKVFWTKRRHSEESSSNETVPSSEASSLVMGPLKRSDLWSSYTCTAHNSKLTPAISSTVIIEINLPPVEITLEAINRTLVTGNTAIFKCHCKGSHPRASIQWTRRHRPLPSTEKVVEAGRVTISTLTLFMTSKDDGAVITCIAKNSALPEFVLKKSHILKVKHKVPVQKIASSKHTMKRNTIHIECKDKNKPIRFTTTWIFNSTRRLTAGECTIVEILHTAFVNEIRKEYYRSLNRNDVFPSNHFNGKESPNCQKIEKSQHSSSKDGNGNVTCNPHPIQADVTFYWSVQNPPSNQTWDMGQAVHAPMKLNRSLIPKLELLCWTEGATGMKDEARMAIILVSVSENRSNNLYLMIAVLCATIICLCLMVFIGRIMKHAQDTISSNHTRKPVEERTWRRIIHGCCHKPKVEKEIQCTAELLNQSQQHEIRRSSKILEEDHL